MKELFQNKIFSLAVACSVLFHAVILSIKIIATETSAKPSVDSGLEIILVNAKSHQKPLNAQALAQVNLEGGGSHDDGRMKSPLPDMRKSEDGDSFASAQKRVEELEQRQKQLLDQVHKETQFKNATPDDKKQVDEVKHSTSSHDDTENTRAFSRSVAEISQTIEDQNKRPRKTFLGPSTQEVGHAIYYKSLQKKIENIGTINFPQINGKKLYGEVIVYIPIFQDGTIYEKEGGPKVEKSSGNLVLDNHALKVVRKAAPFGQFPSNMRSRDKDDVWIVVTRFKFTREEQLQTEVRDGTQKN